MKIYLAILGLFALTLGSYQPAVASANNFTSHAVVSGDNLTKILRKVGFTGTERETILKSSGALRSLFLTLDTKYLLKNEGANKELRVYDSQDTVAFRILRTNSKIEVLKVEPNFKVVSKKVQGKVHGSLMGSVLNKIKSNWVATRFLDAYAFELNPRAVHKGVPFWLTVEQLYDAGHFIKYGEVTQASLFVDGEELIKKFVRNNRGGGVFFTDSKMMEQRPLYAPVDYIKIASHFKPNRLHPITKKRQPHLGIDFELPVGDPVYAAKKGSVVRFGKNKAAGNYIVLAHANGMETSYNHLNKLSPKIKKGLRVSAGQKIAEIGCTGYCTRAHLHFAVRKQGTMVNPINYIKPYPSHMEEMLQNKVAQN